MTTPRKKSEAEHDDWMSAVAAAAACGGKSRLWLYEQALNGDVRHTRVAGRRVFHRDDVMRLAERLAGGTAIAA